MAAGRRPKPTRLKLVEGNPGKRKLPDKDLHFGGEIGACPEWFTDRARAEWDAVIAALGSIGMLSRVHRGTLISYCVFTDMVEAAAQALAKLDSGTRAYRGKFLELRQASDAQRYLAQEFGLTPSAQAKIATAAPKQPASRMEALLD